MVQQYWANPTSLADRAIRAVEHLRSQGIDAWVEDVTVVFVHGGSKMALSVKSDLTFELQVQDETERHVAAMKDS